MSELVVNPEIPYVGNVSGKLEPGKICRIQGVTLPQIDRFTINLQTGPNAKPRDDTALHISVRLNQGYIARNSYQNGEWGDEHGSGRLTIGPGQAFEILILTDVRDYKVAVNGEHFCEFPHRIPLENVSHLLIDGDVKITLVSWELSVPVAPISEPSSVNTNTSQQFNAGQYFPPNNYQPQGPQGPPFGGPGQYGPPIPPGAQAQTESGFGGFFEQAQDALVGAIKSGAAEKLLSGLLSTGSAGDNRQGYAPQNAQYGIYPQLPPPEDNFAKGSSQNTQTRGPLETFLSGLLSNTNNPDPANQTAYTRPEQPGNLQFNNHPPADAGPQSYGQYPAPPPQQQQQNRGPLENILSGILPSGNNQQGNVNPPPQQPHLPQVGGEGSFGGLGSMGGLLSNLAGQILHNPKGNN